MSDQLLNTAKQLMEAIMQWKQRGSSMQNRGVSSQKPGEIMVLYCISLNRKEEVPGMMVSEISGKLNVTSPTVTQHINSLEAQGLVERLADPADRRIVRVRLTDEGEKCIQLINEARLQMFVGLVEYLGEEESRVFAETMKKASDYIMNQREKHMKDFLANGEGEK